MALPAAAELLVAWVMGAGSAALTEQMAKTAEWEAEAMSPEAVTCGKLAATEVELTGPTVEARAVEGGAA